MSRFITLYGTVAFVALASCLGACTTDKVQTINAEGEPPPDGSVDGPSRSATGGARTTGGSGGAGGGGTGGTGSGPVAGAPGSGGGEPTVPACGPAPAVKKGAAEKCQCDNECAGGACLQSACCSGAACAQRPEGATCETGAQCRSGFCADGICCNLACTGACVSCNQAGKMGECRPVAMDAPDPHKLCRKDAPDSCGQNGLCNGQGGCQKYTAGTICKAASCPSVRNLAAASVCDGQGACGKGIAIDCAPWTCDGGACRLRCADNTQCVAPNSCRSGSCGRFPMGSKCDRSDQCLSNFCVDGVCCDNACGSRCSYCAFANSPGRCAAVPAGVRDPRAAAGVRDPARVCLDQGATSCGTNGMCNGSRACETYPSDTVCRQASCDPTSNTETAVSVCREGRCQTAQPRSCAPFGGCNGPRCSNFCAGNDQCVSGASCLNGSCGKLAVGAPCSRSDQCATPGICAQGRCCATACSGSCQSCALDGSFGQCKPVPAGGTDPTGTCGKDACTGGCNGLGACKREAAGTSCKDASCGTASTLVSWKCSAAGACEMASQTCGAGESCASNRCAKVPQDTGAVCVASGDCKSGACIDGHCCDASCTAGCTTCSDATAWKCSAVVCPAGQACNAGAANKCEPVGRNQGETCGGDNGTCKSPFHCVMGTCCTTQCTGPCVTGKCGVGGVGCETKAAGSDCGTSCSNASTLVTKKCEGATCASVTTMCAVGQTCSGSQCQVVMVGKGPGESCSNASPCRDTLQCVEGICCAHSCAGACHDGCKADGSACKLRGTDHECGSTTCAGTTLTKQLCNAAGECKSTPSSCPATQACSANQCQTIKKDAGGACGSTAECKDALACVVGICCQAAGCGAGCQTGTCKADGSGCQLRPVDAECGAATCAVATLTRQLCNAAGECKAVGSACPVGQACSSNACAAVAPPPPPTPVGRTAGESCGGSNGTCLDGLSCLAGRCCKSACAGPCEKPFCDATGACNTSEMEGQDCSDNGKRSCRDGQCLKD